MADLPTIDFDGLSLEQLVDLADTVQKKLDARLHKEQAELEDRRSKLEKIAGRISGAKAKPGKATKPRKAKDASSGGSASFHIAVGDSSKETGASGKEASAGGSES